MYIHFDTTIWRRLLKKPILGLSCECPGVHFFIAYLPPALTMQALSRSPWGALPLVRHVRVIPKFFLYALILNYSGNKSYNKLGIYAFIQRCVFFFFTIGVLFSEVRQQLKKRNVILT